jgi:protease IV
MIRKLFRSLGLLVLCIILFSFAVFFYAYLTGGETKVLTLFGGDVIGVLEIEGSIDSSREAVHGLKRFVETRGIKAVVVRIDSPGGAVAPTQEIYNEIARVRKEKPVVASLGSVAASGGYYIASACDRVVANPGTLTGSIGVIMELGNIEELMKKLGVKGYAIKSGPHKDIGSPFRPLTPEGRAILQGLVDNVHGQFVSAVAKGRKMPEAKVRDLADGRIFSGEQAKELGLVDELGGLENAIETAAKRAGIEGVPQVVYFRGDTRSWWEQLVFSFFGRPGRGSERWWLRYEWSPLMVQ